MLDSTSMYQVLLKSPFLFSHYKEHKTRDPQVSFVAFLSMHYWGQHPDDNDDERDMQLPFKKTEVQPPCFLYVPFNKVFVAIAHEWHIKLDYGPEKPQLYYNPTLETLFRPPKA